MRFNGSIFLFTERIQFDFHPHIPNLIFKDTKKEVLESVDKLLDARTSRGNLYELGWIRVDMYNELYQAYQRITQKLGDSEGFRVEVGRGSGFWNRVNDAVSEFGLARNKQRISDHKLSLIFHDTIMNIAAEVGPDLSQEEFENELQTRLGSKFADWLANPPDTFAALFPVNIRGKYLPDEVQLFESKAVQIPFEEWKRYLELATSSEKSNFGPFLDEIPNDISGEGLERYEWAYFSVEIRARDEFYAVSRVKDLLEIRLAEINFFDNLWSGDIPRPTSKPSYERWSRLQIPPFILLFYDDIFSTYWGLDYDYRRSAGILHFTQSDVDEIEEVPSFDPDARKNSFEGFIVSALLAYQDGITERSVRQSFFSFWRGVEMLSNTSNSGKMVERGKLAYTYYKGPIEDWRPELVEALEELDDIRHELVHQGLRTPVSRSHQIVAKTLLDGLLRLYIEKYCEWNFNEMASFLRHGTQYGDKIRFMIEIISKISSESQN